MMARTHLLDDPAHWYDRAHEARILAERMDDAESRATMLRIAEDYVNLAGRAEQRLVKKQGKST
jgi:hypothetical protein